MSEELGNQRETAGSQLLGEQVVGEMKSALGALEGLNNFSPETAEGLNQLHQKMTGVPGEGGEAKPPVGVEAQEQGSKGQAAGGEKGSEAGEGGQAGEGNEPGPEGEGGDEGGEGSESATAGEGSGAEGSEEEIEIESPLFGGKKVIGKKPKEASEELKIENLEGLSKHLNESYGIESVEALDSNIKDWREKEEQLADVSTKYSNIENLFGNMPQELYVAITKFANGEDWKSAVQQSAIDFTKEAKDYSDKELVDAIAPGELTPDDWSEYQDDEGDPNVKRLVQSKIDSAKIAFDSKKNAIKQASEEQVLKAQERQQKFSDSAKASREFFANKYTDADTSTLEALDNDFTKGGINDVFYNKDGTVKEDAYLRLAMAKHGAELIDQYKKIAEGKIKTEARQEVLSVTAQQPRTTQGSGIARGKEEISPEVQAELDEIRKLSS